VKGSVSAQVVGLRGSARGAVPPQHKHARICLDMLACLQRARQCGRRVSVAVPGYLWGKGCRCAWVHAREK